MCPQNFATFVLTPHIHATPWHWVIIKTLPLDNLGPENTNNTSSQRVYGSQLVNYPVMQMHT